MPQCQSVVISQAATEFVFQAYLRCCLFCRLHALRREPEVAHHRHVPNEPSDQRRRGRLLLQARARISGQCDVRREFKYQVTVRSRTCTCTGLWRLSGKVQYRAKQSRLFGALCNSC